MDDNRHKTLNPIRWWLNRLAKERAGDGMDDPAFFVFISAVILLVGSLVLITLGAIEVALWEAALGWFAFFNVTIVVLVVFGYYAYVVTAPEEN